jgi:hypothetical protein
MGGDGQLPAWEGFSPFSDLQKPNPPWTTKLRIVAPGGCNKGKDFELGSERFLLQPEALVHEPLQARLVEDIVGEFLIREHCQGGSFRTGH